MTQKDVDEKKWMVRVGLPKKNSQSSFVKSFLLHGPLTQSAVESMLQEGRLDLDSEVCEKNNYWFSLRETAEVEHFFGKDFFIKAALNSKDQTSNDSKEATETDLTLEQIEIVSRHFDQVYDQRSAVVKNQGQSSMSASTATVSVKRSSQYPNPLLAKSPSDADLQVDSSKPVYIEKSRYFGILIFVSVCLIVYGFLWVLRRLT